MNKHLIEIAKKIDNDDETTVDELLTLGDFALYLGQRELNLEKGSATRSWLEKYNPDHPLLTNPTEQ